MPPDQAWIETPFGRINSEWPHLERITDDEQKDAGKRSAKQPGPRGLIHPREMRMEYRRILQGTNRKAVSSWLSTNNRCVPFTQNPVLIEGGIRGWVVIPAR